MNSEAFLGSMPSNAELTQALRTAVKAELIKKVQAICGQYEEVEARRAVDYVRNLDDENWESKMDVREGVAAAKTAREIRDAVIILIHQHWPKEGS